MPTLQFKGKNIIWNHHLAVPFHTLEEVPELHYKAEKANDNMIIEGDNLINEADFYVGEHGKQAIYLVYKQDYDTLTPLALNLTLAGKMKEQQPGKKRIVYAPSCILDEDYLTDIHTGNLTVCFHDFCF